MAAQSDQKQILIILDAAAHPQTKEKSGVPHLHEYTYIIKHYLKIHTLQ